MKIKRNLNIRQKIQLFILSTTAVVFAVAISYIAINSKNRIYSITTELADSYAKEYANLSKDRLNYYMDATRFLSQTFENYKIIPEENRREVLSGILKQLLKKNEKFLSVWSILNPNTIDNLDSLYINTVGSTVLGNFRYVYYRYNNTIKLSDYIEQDPNEVLTGSVYTQVKNRRRETIVDPYYYSYSGNKKDEVLETNMVAPVIVDGDFIGVVGIDVPLATLQEMIDEYQPIKGSFAFLMTKSGEIVTFPDKDAIGDSFTEIDFISKRKNAIAREIKQGKSFSFNTTYRKKDYYVSIAPVPVGKTGTPWYVGLALPQNVIMETATKNLNISIIVGLIGLIILGVVIWFLSEDITKPIKKLTNVIRKISTGDVDKSLKPNIQSGDEIAEMGLALNKYIDGYVNKTEFASKIGEGNLDSEFHLLSENDYLGDSLIRMRDSLKKAREEEKKRQQEDTKRRWVNEGIAKFAELLRQNNDDLHNLGYSIISNLVEYMNANQGGVFVLNDEDKNDVVYELIGAYAFNRKKFIEKTMRPGEGLVGTCALEKETLHLTNIPQDYISITSGLGGTNPDSLLIVPLKVEEQVLGVLELASFNKFEPYQVEFVEKVAQSIGSTLSSVRVNLKTSELLEKSQQQAEEMSAQEEEMRQNMEELQATQEEAARRENELKGLLEAIDQFLIKAEMDTSGNFLNANEQFLETMNYTLNELQNKNIQSIIPEEESEQFKQLWNRLNQGENYKGQLINKTKTGAKIKLISSYIPVKDQDGEISKILLLAIHNETEQA
jgi:methyl-accepting chemotaxis protein